MYCTVKKDAHLPLKFEIVLQKALKLLFIIFSGSYDEIIKFGLAGSGYGKHIRGRIVTFACKIFATGTKAHGEVINGMGIWGACSAFIVAV
jgi:hypothetical protein